jgi:uncharacterized protein (DUF58 family)
VANDLRKQSLFQGVARIRKWPSIEITVAGLVYCSMMTFMGFAAVQSGANLLYGIFGMMMGILLVSGVIGRMVLKRLTIERIVPEHGVVGQPVTLLYQIHNGKRYWPSVSVGIGELDGAEAFTRQPHAYLLHAAAKSTETAPAVVIARRRGVHHFDRIQVMTGFPFGFIRRAIRLSRQDAMVIYPAIGRVDQRVIQMCRSAETTGPMIRPRRGGTDEFYGVKEYRAGENPRWIYWRRSARTGTLVSREMTQVLPPRILLLVDTMLADRSIESHAAVERVIAMAASLASEALEQGLSVGFIAWSGNEWGHLPPNRGKRHRRDLLSALAQLQMNTTQSRRELLEENHRLRESGTTSILMTPSQMRLNLAESARGDFLVLSSALGSMERWFKFDDAIDFSGCMPLEQELDMRDAVEKSEKR